MSCDEETSKWFLFFAFLLHLSVSFQILLIVNGKSRLWKSCNSMMMRHFFASHQKLIFLYCKNCQNFISFDQNRIKLSIIHQMSDFTFLFRFGWQQQSKNSELHVEYSNYISFWWKFQIGMTWSLFFAKIVQKTTYFVKYKGVHCTTKIFLNPGHLLCKFIRMPKMQSPPCTVLIFLFLGGISKKVELAGRLEIFHPNKIWK